MTIVVTVAEIWTIEAFCLAEWNETRAVLDEMLLLKMHVRGDRQMWHVDAVRFH